MRFQWLLAIEVPIYDIPLAATFGRGRLRDPDVLLPFLGPRAMPPTSPSRHSSRHDASRQRNRLLAALSPADLALLQPHLNSLAVAVRHEIERPNRRIESVYFMDAGIASVVAVQADETQVEVGLVGPEGMTGTAVVLGGDQTPHSTYIQVAGEAQWIKADQLRKAMRASDSLRAVLLKYVQTFMVQTTHTAIANARAHIDRRLARWILMAQDRTGNKTLPLTHEFLALMLGVRRPGVTETLQILTRQKLIETGRNKIVVLNRNGLEKMAGYSYGVPEKEYRRLIG
jgi:CRP-like cAMP-binding protein